MKTFEFNGSEAGELIKFLQQFDPKDQVGINAQERLVLGMRNYDSVGDAFIRTANVYDPNEHDEKHRHIRLFVNV